MKITMKSNLLLVTEVKKRKTKAEFFKNLKVGDVIQLSMETGPVGYGSSGIYASRLTISKIPTISDNDFTTNTFNGIEKILQSFPLLEC